MHKSDCDRRDEISLPKVENLTGTDIDRELQKGYDDVVAGRMKPARQVFAEIHKDYGI